MKKIFLGVAFLASISMSSVYAQKNTKKSSTNIPQPIELKTEIDSLSYAYGVKLSNEGLEMHLEQIGVIKSTQIIEFDYNRKISEATNEAEKSRLQTELQDSLQVANKINQDNIEIFLKGMNFRINSTPDNAAYYSGIEIANQLINASESFSEYVFGKDHNADENLNMHLMAAGIANGLQKKALKIDNISSFIDDKIELKKSEVEKREQQKYNEKIVAGEQFMRETALKDGIVSLESGLLYSVDKMGHGDIPTASDKVKVHYTGRLTDGTVFDSSTDRGEPITFGVSQVIKGWIEILQLMPVGSKWTIYVPYELAYGATGPEVIGNYSNLIFDIELLEIIKNDYNY